MLVSYGRYTFQLFEDSLLSRHLSICTYHQHLRSDIEGSLQIFNLSYLKVLCPGRLRCYLPFEQHQSSFIIKISYQTLVACVHELAETEALDRRQDEDATRALFRL